MVNIATSIILITFCMSFAIYLGTGEGTMFTRIIGLSSSTGTLYLGFLALITVAGVSGIAVGLFSFPNPYAIFSVITILLLGFFTLPIDLLTSTTIPSTIKLFVGGVFGIMYILAVLGWFHGGQEP